MILEFRTEKKLTANNTINIAWHIANEEIADQCYHSREFLLDKPIEQIISEYEPTAKQAIFEVINSKFPNLYTL
jgi:hypothetical protein